MRHLWIACTALLAACFTDSGALPTTDAPATTVATSTASTTSTSTTTDPATSTSTSTSTTGDPVGTTTDPSATTSSLTSSTTTGDTTGAGSTTGNGDLPVPGCDPLYFSDFSQDDGGLVYDGGTWNWNQGAGELNLAVNGGSVSAWIPDVLWQDFVVYTRVRIDSGTGYASLRARGKPNTGNYYYASASIGDQRVVVGITAGGQWTNQGITPVPLMPGTWYLLRFDVLNQDLIAQIEGAAAKFTHPQFVEGSAGLGGFGTSSISFDWFLVCKP